jgi:prevent-host-death family protein
MALPKKPTTETISVSEARQKLSETLNRVREDNVRYIVEKSGIPVAAVVPLSVLEEAERKEAARLEAIRAFEAVQSGFVGVSEEEAEQEIAKALEEIKRERRMARKIAAALINADPELFNSSEESLTNVVVEFLQDEEARRLSETPGLEGPGA